MTGHYYEFWLTTEWSQLQQKPFEIDEMFTRSGHSSVFQDDWLLDSLMKTIYEHLIMHEVIVFTLSQHV
jgi:hypothetical protein